ncbi:MAG TPA: histidine phosphatase family protein, partial [Symbiobacteriaceae bacterium]|nr:histidine phosphatase family protein [Symbiobacteriaceae bacterium]
MHALICLVRHGATDWNYDGRAQGLADIPLNLEGKRQAEVVAARLARESWDGLYSSPLKRAMATAEAIGRQTGLGVCPEPGLIERDVTPIEGTTHLERDLRWPGGAYRELPGMESMAAVAVRAAACLQELAARHPGGRLVCVSHGGWIYSFLEAQGFRTG